MPFHSDERELSIEISFEKQQNLSFVSFSVNIYLDRVMAWVRQEVGLSGSENSQYLEPHHTLLFYNQICCIRIKFGIVRK